MCSRVSTLHSYIYFTANKRQQDQLHNELSQRLAGKPAVKSKPQNPNVYLSTKSSAKEVVEWLYSKSFSQKYVCVSIK